MEENTSKTHEKRYDWLKPYQFKIGNKGGGRPKGSKSLKAYAKEYLESLPEEEQIEYLNSLPRDFVWKMAEGNPKQDLGGDLDLNINRVIRLDE